MSRFNIGYKQDKNLLLKSILSHSLLQEAIALATIHIMLSIIFQTFFFTNKAGYGINKIKESTGKPFEIRIQQSRTSKSIP